MQTLLDEIFIAGMQDTAHRLLDVERCGIEMRLSTLLQPLIFGFTYFIKLLRDWEDKQDRFGTIWWACLCYGCNTRRINPDGKVPEARIFPTAPDKISIIPRFMSDRPEFVSHHYPSYFA